MSQADLDTNRMVRTILVRHWIDLGRLSVRSTDGKLWVRGSLARISGVNEELTPQIVDAIFDEIRRLKTVKQYYCTLENWNNDSGSWRETGKTKIEKQVTPRIDTVYDIGSEPEKN